ncbi:Heparinase II/III-like [hydrothermal vent metagenome]|uniref:Heparinase II/III-like n=1 Tax=hydrothermal vent metagenome TaxID=652676 RepID=A0A3B0TZN4_9ZZZZ
MLNLTRLRKWRTGCIIADKLVTSPLVRWTWSGLTEVEYNSSLREFRPSDHETIREMMRGRYLLASRLVDTAGVSPFAVEQECRPWHDELHGFSWLRHFRDECDARETRFAHMLVLDWIGRNSNFNSENWGLATTAQRVMNWLRNYSLLYDGASREQMKTIARSISKQVQSLRLRTRFALDPVDELMGSILPVAVALSDGSDQALIGALTAELCGVLEQHIDSSGLHRSRNPAVQLYLLFELVSLRLTLSQKSSELARELGTLVDKMHLALDCVTLGTGAPAYFNGCGQLAGELMFAVQTQGSARRAGNTLVSGYGLIEDGASTVILDAGNVPPPRFAQNAHASALAFEFSHGHELVVGNCGPAPDELSASKDLFRQGAAHSGPTINDQSAARIGGRGVLYATGEEPFVEVGQTEPTITARTSAYRSRFGVEIERQVSLMSFGRTLVGQDRVRTPLGQQEFSGKLMQRFHLAPGAKAIRAKGEEIINIRLQSGAMWTFLWEGATARIENSVRQSAHIGYYRTQQIVLEAPLAADLEIAWIFTLQ